MSPTDPFTTPVFPQTEPLAIPAPQESGSSSVDLAAPATPARTTPQSDKTRRGFVARLPKETRERINTMIEDGVPYLETLARIGPEAAHITEKHMANWRSGGYQDWLREQQKINLLRNKRDFAFDLLARNNGSQIPQTILQLLATNVCEFLVDLDPANLRESLLSDSDKFSRFVGTMVKLADGEIKCERHQNLQDDRAAAAAKQKAPGEKPGISDESLRVAEEKLKLM